VGDPARGFDKRQPGGWVFCILPQLEQQNVFDLAGYAQDNAERRARLATMIQTPLATFHCPSRRSAEIYPNRWQPFNSLPVSSVAKCDYAANAGDVFFDVGSGPVTLAQGDHAGYHWPAYPATGVVFLRSAVRVASVTDGTTQTYLVGEKNVPSSAYDNGDDRGDDQSMYSGDDFDTVRWTTNGWTPLNDDPGDSAEARFGSAHSSGCNFVFCDGSVRSVAYTVDAQVHQRLGSRSDGHVVSLPSD
jgi:prepilin-type processing-associated H-X9-DG protein